MKKTPYDKKVLERMAPGVLSKDGFLGEDTRPVSEIIASDAATLRGLGVSREVLASAMQQVFDAARDSLGRPVEAGGRLEAVYRESMGRIPSPWPGEGVFQKGEVEVRDKETGQTMRYTPLSVHLVREHGFFQGRGALYRLDPEKLCRLLGLPKGG